MAPPAPTAAYPTAPTAPMAPMAPMAPKPPSPLHLSDRLRDLAALFFLGVTLWLPWDVSRDTTDRWWLVTAVTVAMVACLIPLIVQYTPIPGGWFSAGAKLFLTLPLIAAVIGQGVYALVKWNADIGYFSDTSEFKGGLAAGVATAAAGIALSLPPRAAEEATPPSSGRGWLIVAKLLGLAAVAAGVLYSVGFLIDGFSGKYSHTFSSFGSGFDWGDDHWGILSFGLAMPLTLIALMGIPALAFAFSGSAASRRVLGVAGLGFADALFMANYDGADGGAYGDLNMFSFHGPFISIVPESWSSPTGASFLVGAAGALALAGPVVRATPDASAKGWVSTARLALIAAGLSCLASGLFWLFNIFDDDTSAPGIAQIVMLGVAGVVALIGGLIAGQSTAQRIITTGATGLVMALGATMSIWALTYDPFKDDNGMALFPNEAVALFYLPILAICALWVPKVMRGGEAPAA